MPNYIIMLIAISLNMFFQVRMVAPHEYIPFWVFHVIARFALTMILYMGLSLIIKDVLRLKSK